MPSRKNSKKRAAPKSQASNKKRTAAPGARKAPAKPIRKKAKSTGTSGTIRKAKAVESEVEAYHYIREQLRELGWVVKSPSLLSGGQVWTQNQCLADPEIKQALGATRPENIVKVTDSLLWVVEAKANRKHLAVALSEAIDDYAASINDSSQSLRAIFATGIAGNDESGYLVETHMRCSDGEWRPVKINKQLATGLLSVSDAQRLAEQGHPDLQDFAPPQKLFLLAAEEINKILHIGGINKNDRAKTIAALLLALIDSPPNLDTQLPVLIGEINARAAAVLKESDKADFAPFVKILLPTNPTNHKKYRHALIRTVQVLLDLNIRSAMNSRSDVLGQFYEVFLKYGNGAKEIGIVLTPRHITRFAVEALGLDAQDVVLDPACGTGGFLVAAFDYVREHANPRDLELFKRHNLFGMEQEPYVAILAIVNMIFRGDGKNNIVEANCFDSYLKKKTVRGHASASYVASAPKPGDEPVTRVLMNPPFSLQASHDKEHRFVTHALKMMRDGGLLFAVLPMDCMFGSGDERLWREHDVLSKHTLLSVISFPDDLFYPSALKQTVGVIIRKGVPHPRQQPVFWARVAHDGYLKLKSKRLPASEFIPPREEPNDMERVLPALRAFIASPNHTNLNEALLCKTEPIDYDDPQLELLPEAYIDSPAIDRAELVRLMDVQARETLAFIVRFNRDQVLEEK